MTNTLYLPELREMLAERRDAEMAEFCTALHPARTAEFMEGLEPSEAWEVLRHADPQTRSEIFGYTDHNRQLDIFRTQPRGEIAELLAILPADDRVDLLDGLEAGLVEELMALVPAEDRRDIRRLAAFDESTAGAMMTTDFARLAEDQTVAEAWDELRRQVGALETVYYVYVVDSEDHLRGVVSARRLLQAMHHPQQKVGDVMERAVVSVHAEDAQEEAVRVVERYDLLAIPVVDQEHHILGIITHDDVVDAVRAEAVEDAQRMGGVLPLEGAYLDTRLFTLARKRGAWLTILFFAALLTALTLSRYHDHLDAVKWLVLFIPLVVSTGGNSGSQSATLVVSGLASGEIELRDWSRIARRELQVGLLLGGWLAMIGFFVALVMAPGAYHALVVPVTVLLVVLSGTLVGSMLPLLFRRLGLDPAIMSTPFVAAIIDVVGILLYMTVAIALLGAT